MQSCNLSFSLLLQSTSPHSVRSEHGELGPGRDVWRGPVCGAAADHLRHSLCHAGIAPSCFCLLLCFTSVFVVLPRRDTNMKRAAQFRLCFCTVFPSISSVIHTTFEFVQKFDFF